VTVSIENHVKQNYTVNTLHQDSITKVKIICDLELLEFKVVAPTFLLERPCSI